MAKDKSKARRDTTDIAKRSLPSLLTEPVAPVRPVVVLKPIGDVLREIEDHRRFHPDRLARPALDVLGRPHSLKSPAISTSGRQPVSRSDRQRRSAPVQSFFNRKSVLFGQPRTVIACVRRKVRREVIFASGKGGRRGQRKPRFNAYSNVRCS